MAKKFMTLGWTNIFQGLICKELFSFKSPLPPQYAIFYKNNFEDTFILLCMAILTWIVHPREWMQAKMANYIAHENITQSPFPLYFVLALKGLNNKTTFNSFNPSNCLIYYLGPTRGNFSHFLRTISKNGKQITEVLETIKLN